MQQLEALYLDCTELLFKSSKEIGKLTKFRTLTFVSSAVKSLSVRRFQNLEDLDLRSDKNLVEFEEDMGRLESLMCVRKRLLKFTDLVIFGDAKVPFRGQGLDLSTARASPNQ